MQLDTTITLTRPELIELVRKAYPEIKNIRQVKIVEDDVREWLNKRTEDESNDWIDVPPDWKYFRCPTEYPIGTILELLFKSGRKVVADCNGYPICWRQDGADIDIVKYRLPKQ